MTNPPEWLTQMSRPSHLSTGRLKRLAGLVATLELFLQQAKCNGTAIDLDGRPASLRVAGHTRPSNDMRYLVAMALDGRNGCVTIEQHSFSWNSTASGCLPERCGTTRLRIQHSLPIKLANVQASGVLQRGTELLSSMDRNVDWLHGVQGGQDPQIGGLALTMANVMMEDRGHTFRMPYFDRVLATIRAAAPMAA